MARNTTRDSEGGRKSAERPRARPRRDSQPKAATRAEAEGPAAGSPPDMNSYPASDSEAASGAIEAVKIAKESHEVVPVASVHPLETGLVDYGMWLDLFSRSKAVEPGRAFRRGRIWA